MRAFRWQRERPVALRTFEVRSHDEMERALRKARHGDRVLVREAFPFRDGLFPIPEGRHHWGTVMVTSDAEVGWMIGAGAQWLCHKIAFTEFPDGGVGVETWDAPERAGRARTPVRDVFIRGRVGCPRRIIV